LECTRNIDGFSITRDKDCWLHSRETCWMRF
jgi:hypothetical protein